MVWSVPLLPSLAGFVIGLVFGAVVQRSDWCAMGAVADIRLMGDWRRMRSWLLAIAVAIGGTQVLAVGGAVDLAATAYRAAELQVLPVVLGAIVFGYGMTMTGGCISKNLVRAGGGSLRALVVLMTLALVALATLEGPLAWLGRFFEMGVPSPGGAGAAGGGAALAFPLAGGLAWIALRDRRFRSSGRLVAAGAVLGLLVPAAWLATAGTGPATAINYVDGSAAVLSALTGDTAGAMPFAVALVAGTVLGAFLAAGTAGRLRWEGFRDTADLRRHLGGAALMGLGGALAGGCTVGQGLSGVSTLAGGSILALGGIVAGAWLGVGALEAGGLRSAIRAGIRG